MSVMCPASAGQVGCRSMTVMFPTSTAVAPAGAFSTIDAAGPTGTASKSVVAAIAGAASIISPARMHVATAPAAPFFFVAGASGDGLLAVFRWPLPFPFVPASLGPFVPLLVMLPPCVRPCVPGPRPAATSPT